MMQKRIHLIWRKLLKSRAEFLIGEIAFGIGSALSISGKHWPREKGIRVPLV